MPCFVKVLQALRSMHQNAAHHFVLSLLMGRVSCCLVCLSQVSYGMTECCGKISMSILDFDWTQHLQQRLLEVQDAGEAAAAEAAFYDEVLQRICTSGRPFLLMEVSACHSTACHSTASLL
jgi:hypothetical protein